MFRLLELIIEKKIKGNKIIDIEGFVFNNVFCLKMVCEFVWNINVNILLRGVLLIVFSLIIFCVWSFCFFKSLEEYIKYFVNELKINLIN